MGQCVDYVCSASCLAVPVGNTCECTQRSSLFPFCCPLSDGSGFYLPCTDGSAAGALSLNEDGVILTPSGCPLDCDCFTGFTGQDCGLTTGGETANAAPCEALDFCSGVGVCCTNSSQYDGTQESAEACFSPPDQETPADDVCWCPPGTRAPNCIGQPTLVVGGGCSDAGDCEGCNRDPACVWCPGAALCVPNGDCQTGGDLTWGAAVVDREVPFCYEECFGNGDCVNDTCICYDFKYIQQDHPYCAPVNSAKNNAAKASIGLIAGGSVGLFVLAVICGVVFLIGTKAAFDAFSMHDEQVNVMENCALYEDPGLSGHSALHEPSA